MGPPALLLAAGAAGAAAAAPRPHIVVALADDFGWANWGLHRDRDGAGAQARAEARTPNLDGLARDGVVLNRHYSYKICSPSRSALQSGRLPVHVNILNVAPIAYNPADPVSGFAGIPRNMTCVANKLQGAGYATHFVGKWDAGMATPQHTPWGRGYGTAYGYFQHANDYWDKRGGFTSTGDVDNCLNSLPVIGPPIVDLSESNATYRGGVLDPRALSADCKKTQTAAGGYECYEEQLFTERSVGIIAAHDPATPFFLCHAFHTVHAPLQVPDAYLARIDAAVPTPFDDKDRRTYAAMALFMDDAVGAIVAALRGRGMWDATLLAFLSDNGGPIYNPGGANNHPLRGGKFSDWEGGVRTNAFVSGGFVPAVRRGQTFDGLFSIADWYTTLCTLAGADPEDEQSAAANEWLAPRGLPLLSPVDGVPQWDAVVGDAPARQKLHLSPDALIVWPYKLITGDQVYSKWTGEVYPNCTATNGTLVPGVSEPYFIDLKVLGRKISLATINPDAPAEAVATWVERAGDGQLYNIRDDPGEHRDLAPEMPAKRKEMAAELRRLNGGNFLPDRGDLSPRACYQAFRNGGSAAVGFYGPFIDVGDYYTPPPPASLVQEAEKAVYNATLNDANRDNATITEITQLVLPLLRKHMFDLFDKCLSVGSDLAHGLGRRIAGR